MSAALASIIIGSAAGGAVISLVLGTSYGMARAVTGGFAIVAGLAGLGGVIAGGVVAWTLGRPLAGVWRRATLAMMGVMGTVLVGVLATVADALAGKTGLLILAALCLGAIWAAYRALLAPPD